MIPLNSSYFHSIGKFGLYFDINWFSIDNHIDSICQMALLPGNYGEILINLVNFELVNANFSFNFLKFTQINRLLSDSKQKFIFEILNSIR